MIRSRWMVLTGSALALGLMHPAAPARIAFIATSHAATSGETSAYLDYLLVRAKELLSSDNRDAAAAVTLLREAVQVGSTSAMLMLADLYARGDGVDPSFREAKALIDGALAVGEGSSAWIALGDLYRNIEGPERSPERAVESYQRAADLGDSGAMLRVARMVGYGEGVPIDFERARTTLEHAISVGDGNLSAAWTNLAELYRRTEGEQRDPAKAIAAYEAALELGNAGVLIPLARMIGAGDGVTADLDRARAYLEQAIELGDDDAWAYISLGDLYRDAKGDQRDPERAIAAYEKAHELGNTDVLLVLARMVGAGDGVLPDFDRARGYVEDVIALGDDNLASAYAALGDLYRTAVDEHRDLANAVDAYQMAVDLGAVGPLIRLARMVSAGEGVSAPDFERARLLLERAVAEDEGNAGWAYAALGDLYRDAAEDKHDPAKAVEAYQRAADLGEIGAMLRLARVFGRGEGVPVDFDRALVNLEKAIAFNGENTASAFSMLGDLYRNAEGSRRDPVKAVEAYERALELGNDDVLIVLARMIAAGDGVSSADFERARGYFLRATTHGGEAAATAYSFLGDLYRNAAGSNRNAALAVDAYTRALELGNTDVLVVLARMIAAGDGAPQDFELARDYLEKAVAIGSNPSLAYSALGDLHSSPANTQRDPARAAEAYQAAVDFGDTGSMLKLARILGGGDDGVEPDFNRARALLNAVVEANDDYLVGGWSQLGDLYRNAEGSLHDPAKAFEAYRHAADLGSTTAMIRMARLLADGDGVSEDFEQARALLERAVAVGGERGESTDWALMSLGDLYRSADDAHRNPVKALDAYNKALALGNKDALVVIARMVQGGDGVAADPDAAKALLEQASAAGGETAVNAWINLGHLYGNPDGDFYDLAAALDYYSRAAEAGSGEAHLLAARIESADDVAAKDNRAALIDRYREAARMLGAEPVARAMYDLAPATLYSVVQGLLSEVDRPISIDGVFGKQMQAAIDRFCAAKQVQSCARGLVSFELLVALLGTTETVRGADGRV